MNLKINRIYEEYDTNMYGDATRVELVDADSGEKLLVGDWYHDHIDDRISGFLECLSHLRIGYSITNEKWRENYAGEMVYD